MSDSLVLPQESNPKAELRRAAILDAALSVFKQKGFELATMQDVATACGMSAGNIYRYFDSKAEIVSGLVERDRTELVEGFVELANAPDQIVGFETIGRHYIRDAVRRKAALTLEIWAAAGRTPDLRQHCENMDCAIEANMADFVSRAVEQGVASKSADPTLVTHIVMAHVESMFRNAVLKKSHDLERDMDVMFAIVKAAMAGHINVPKNTTSNEK